MARSRAHAQMADPQQDIIPVNKGSSSLSEKPIVGRRSLGTKKKKKKSKGVEVCGLQGQRKTILSIKVTNSSQTGQFLWGHAKLILTLSMGSSCCCKHWAKKWPSPPINAPPVTPPTPPRSWPTGRSAGVYSALRCQLVRQDLAGLSPSHTQRWDVQVFWTRSVLAACEWTQLSCCDCVTGTKIDRLHHSVASLEYQLSSRYLLVSHVWPRYFFYLFIYF